MKKFRIILLLSVCLMLCFSSVAFASNFYDIKGTEYEGVVDRVARLGIINGLNEKTFGPNKSITRGQLAKMIVYTRGLQDYADQTDFKPMFKDIKNHWARDYIYVAVDLGILKGYDDGTFKPDKEVSYAEVIAIVMRSLGYTRLDETSGSVWYTPYVKRMYEIELHKGLPTFSSYTAPAKRGDVAILWWNMLVSDRWALKAEYEVSGFYYTYSDQTQLQLLFPKYEYVTGVVTGIENGNSGDMIGVGINHNYYPTESEVQIHSLGAIGTGVYDTKEKVMYGFSVDDEFVDYKMVSGPIFYLKEQGYKLNSSKREAVYGSKADATFAYLFVSKEDNSILRSVLVDGSKSVVVESVKVEFPKDDKSDYPRGKVYLNGSEDVFATTDAVVIKKGLRVDWKELPDDCILTTLIPGMLYTYETKGVEGLITNYENLDKELWLDEDKYLISEDCVYTVLGKYEDEGKKELKVFSYDRDMKKVEMEELISRNVIFHLNAAEEVSWVEFGKYRPENVLDKYDNSDYKFFYLDDVYYRDGDDEMAIAGTSVVGNRLQYTVKSKDEWNIGDLISVSEIEGKTAQKVNVVDKNGEFGDDIFVIYEPDGEFHNNAFGEYNIVEDTLIYRVIKDYKDNSSEKVDNTDIKRVDSIEDLGDLEKYRIVLLCNEKMEIDIVFAERDVNKTTYPVARIIELDKNKEFEFPKDKEKENYVYVLDAEIAIVGEVGGTYQILSGDCEAGELVTFELDSERLIVKERFKTVFLGYEKDLKVESFDKDSKTAKIVGSKESLDLKDITYDYNGKVYDLLDYKFMLSKVRKNPETGEWGFITANFFDKEELELQPGDRIAFGELNGIAIIYRGWTK